MSSLRRSLSALIIYIALDPAVTRRSWRSEVCGKFQWPELPDGSLYIYRTQAHQS